MISLLTKRLTNIFNFKKVSKYDIIEKKLMLDPTLYTITQYSLTKKFFNTVYMPFFYALWDEAELIQENTRGYDRIIDNKDSSQILRKWKIKLAIN